MDSYEARVKDCGRFVCISCVKARWHKVKDSLIGDVIGSIQTNNLICTRPKSVIFVEPVPSKASARLPKLLVSPVAREVRRVGWSTQSPRLD
jgi:hypothetical protein